MKYRSSQFPSLVTITRTLESVYGLTLAREIRAFRDIMSREAKHRGWKTTCTYLKDLYTQAVAMSLSLTPDPIPFRKSDRFGFDRNLLPFKKLLQSEDPDHKRAGLTILRQCYLIYSDPVLDVTSITSVTKGNGIKSIVRSFTTFTRRWVPPMDPVGAIKVIPRARSGPNGPSSLLSGHLDAVALSQRPELLQALQDLADCIDAEGRGEPQSKLRTWDPQDCPEITSLPDCGPENKELWTRGLKPWVLRLTAWTKSKFEIKELLPISRLALLAEGGCKTRTIAIGDLFSQAVLKPIHQKVMDRLRSLEQDCTFDQGRAVSFLQRATQTGPVYSFDLTSATDRFPVLLQEIVMRSLFGKKFATLWRKVMTDLRDFSLKSPKTTLHGIYYKQGQGMGLYSSWPVFAYSHHMLVQWCAVKAGVGPKRKQTRSLKELPFKDYRIIGDDVTIANREVATKYREILSLLEVPISMKKSIMSDTKPYCGEIAKRIITNGIDISPIPPELVKQAGQRAYMLPSLIDEIGRRYGLNGPTLSRLPALASNFSRSKTKEQASILLSAPLAFALWGGHPFYGANLNKGNVGQEPSALATLKQSPWVRVDPEVVSDLGLIQERIRKVFLLRQYEEVFKEWSFFDAKNGISESPTIRGPKGSGDKPDVTAESQHPFWMAHGWINCELISLFETRVCVLGYEDETSMEDIGLRFCLDPSLRVYRDKKARTSRIASHLTLEVFKILTGEKPLPEIEHPKDGLRAAQVRFTAH